MAQLIPAPDGYPIKLVRDCAPDIINSTGESGELFYGTADSFEEYEILLRKKLGEEVTEFLVTGGHDELVDVYAVVDALARRVFNDSDIDRTFRDDPRGGFTDGVVMYGRHQEFDGKGV